MTQPPVARFLREALAEDESAEAQELTDAQALLSGALGPKGSAVLEDPSPEIRARLLARVSILPDKYAPFFDALMTVFDVDEAMLRRDLERAREPHAWNWTGLPGIRVFPMSGGPKTHGAETALVRFPAGRRFPRHRHKGDEVTLILEGGYTDERGIAYHPGDLDPRGIVEGEHAFTTFATEPCIAASVHRGFDFSAWPLRVLQRLTGR